MMNQEAEPSAENVSIRTCQDYQPEDSATHSKSSGKDK